MDSLRINKTVANRIAQGHPWIYRNELPDLPADFSPGELVELKDSRGKFVAIGYCNPKSVISVRILSREREKIDGDVFAKRIAQALCFRKRFYAEEGSHRVVHSEAYPLPALLVDRYGSSTVIPLFTAGMERHTSSIIAAIESLCSP